MLSRCRFLRDIGRNFLQNVAKQERIPSFSKLRTQKIHTTIPRLGLLEFFDEQENWETLDVPVGRSWDRKELRCRSNEDLHKLWYVLLKEMNMLLTMKAEYDRLYISFPSADRLEKVEVSMDNLRDVVDERDSAYSVLEEGEEPHPKWMDDTDELGRPIRRLEEEHLIPRENNEEFLKKYDHLGDWARQYMMYWNEKQRKKESYYYVKSIHFEKKLLEKYPHLAEDREFLREYCIEKTRPADHNPDVEQLIKKASQQD